MLPWTWYAYGGLASPNIQRGFPMVRIFANSDLVAAANLLKQQPPGARMLQPFEADIFAVSAYLDYLNDAANLTATGNQRGVWPSNAQLTTFYNTVFPALLANGATLDFVALDFEDSFDIFDINYPTDSARLPAIQADPRAAAIAAAVGFADFTTEIALDLTTPQTHLPQKTAWDDYFKTQVQNGLRAGIQTPMLNSFPAAGMSNFNSAKIAQADEQQDGDGYPFYQTDGPVGNTASPVRFGGEGALHFLPTVGGVPPRTNDPFWVLIWQENAHRAALRSIGSNQCAPWVQAYSVTSDPALGYPLGLTQFWSENIRLAWLGSSGFLLYLNRAQGSTAVAPASDDQLLDSIAQEIFIVSNGHTPAAWLTTAEVPYATTDFFYAYVRLTDNSTLGRVVFNGTTSTASFTAPDGISYTVNRPVGQQGAWFGTSVPTGGGGVPATKVPMVLNYRMQGSNPPSALRIRVS